MDAKTDIDEKLIERIRAELDGDGFEAADADLLIDLITTLAGQGTSGVGFLLIAAAQTARVLGRDDLRWRIDRTITETTRSDLTGRPR